MHIEITVLTTPSWDWVKKNESHNTLASSNIAPATLPILKYWGGGGGASYCSTKEGVLCMIYPACASEHLQHYEDCVEVHGGS